MTRLAKITQFTNSVSTLRDWVSRAIWLVDVSFLIINIEGRGNRDGLGIKDPRQQGALSGWEGRHVSVPTGVGARGGAARRGRGQSGREKKAWTRIVNTSDVGYVPILMTGKLCAVI